MTTETLPAEPAINYLTQVADIVAAFVSNNSIPAADLPALIASVHASFTHLGSAPAPAAVQESLIPAVSIKKSLSADFLICLDDGKKFRSLKRHLSTPRHDACRIPREVGLPADYPMVAPAYSAQRSALAKSSGLGNGRAAAKKMSDEKVKEPSKGRGRPRKLAA